MVELSNHGIVECLNGEVVVFESSNGEKVELWNLRLVKDGVVVFESSNGGVVVVDRRMVEWWHCRRRIVQWWSCSCRIVQWWNGCVFVVKSSNRRMVEWWRCRRRIVELSNV